MAGSARHDRQTELHNNILAARPVLHHQAVLALAPCHPLRGCATTYRHVNRWEALLIGGLMIGAQVAGQLCNEATVPVVVQRPE